MIYFAAVKVGKIMCVNYCDNAVQNFLVWGFLPPSQFFSFNFSNILENADNYTDVVDLGENNKYTFLIARKIGDPSGGEFLDIQSSVDGVKWAPAFGWYGEFFIARYKPDSARSVFCVWGRPIGRYVRVYHKNGSAVQGELIIELAVFGGV